MPAVPCRRQTARARQRREGQSGSLGAQAPAQMKRGCRRDTGSLPKSQRLLVGGVWAYMALVVFAVAEVLASVAFVLFADMLASMPLVMFASMVMLASMAFMSVMPAFMSVMPAFMSVVRLTSSVVL